MLIKYDVTIDKNIVIARLKKDLNQIYKLLPTREEQGDWRKPLDTLIEELTGMESLFLDNDYQEYLFILLCKLEGLKTLDNDFMLYRRIIFECLSIMQELIDSIWTDQKI